MKCPSTKSEELKVLQPTRGETFTDYSQIGRAFRPKRVSSIYAEKSAVLQGDFPKVYIFFAFRDPIRSLLMGSCGSPLINTYKKVRFYTLFSRILPDVYNFFTFSEIRLDQPQGIARDSPHILSQKIAAFYAGFSMFRYPFTYYLQIVFSLKDVTT